MPQQPLARVPMDTVWTWQEHAACQGVDQRLFFHPQNERGNLRRQRDRAAKSICARCPVRIECADYAVRAHEPYGVWGGLTEEDRAAIYGRIDVRKYPRATGSGAAIASFEIEQTVAGRALN